MKQFFLKSRRDCLVVGAAIVIGFFINGTARLSGLLYVASLERYHVGREKASLPFIVCFGVRNLSSPIIGYLGAKFGPSRIVLTGCVFAAIGVGACYFAEDFIVVIISWGCLFGLGFGMGSALVPQILSQHFSRDVDKANGLFLCGVSIAGIILPVLGDYSIKTYGISGSFLIFSSALLHTIPAAMILGTATINLSRKSSSHNPEATRTKLAEDEFGSTRNPNDNSSEIPLKQSEGTKTYVLCQEKPAKESNINVSEQIEKAETLVSTLPDGRKTAIDSFRLFLDPTYILMLLTQGTVSYVSVAVWTIVVDYSRDHGVEESYELHVLEGLNVFEFLGRIFLGYITDSGYITKTNVSSLCFVSVGILLLIFTCLKGFVFVMIAVSIYGILTGFLVVVGLGIVHQYIEKENSSMGFAALYTVYGLMSFSQSPLIGYFREKLRSYDGLFYLMAAMCFLSSILTLLIPRAARHKDTRDIAAIYSRDIAA